MTKRALSGGKLPKKMSMKEQLLIANEQNRILATDAANFKASCIQLAEMGLEALKQGELEDVATVLSGLRDSGKVTIG